MLAMNLLSVTHAEKIIRSTQNKARTVECALASSLGKILAESIVADRDQPSADRSSMDGIALSMATWKKGCREFSIEGVQKAGIAAKTLKK